MSRLFAPARSSSTPPRLGFIAGLGVLTAIGACNPGPRSPAFVPESAEACEQRQRQFVQFVSTLPERSLAAVQVQVPASSIGGVLGNGPVLQFSEDTVVLDGEVIAERTFPERVERVRRWASRSLEVGTSGASATANVERTIVYVAAASDLEVRTLSSYLAAVPEGVPLKLLVSAAGQVRQQGGASRATELAAKLLGEQEPRAREELANDAYREFTGCAPLLEAIAGASSAPAEQRWAARRAALLRAAPHCRCSDMDTASLQAIVLAEQRAGSAGLAALPASYLRDPRCVASMPRRSIGKLVKQIEAFDEEFAGSFKDDAVQFEQVVSDERLLNYFCAALPGETLAAQQRARATMYWRTPGSAECQAWRFEPLAPGAPMGTWRRVPREGHAELAFHYWQAAEEIRLFGPVSAAEPTKPTDTRDWQCQQTYKMVGVDARSIQTEEGRWYLDEAACRAAPDPSGAGAGCVSTLSAPQAQPAPTSAP